ncbi:MAG: PEP-CTERM system TPR-repeat protein PrsT [Gammaproteobacteria bacterium]|nr:PEP-CTERM system TPR-repeat protein PrsT [Gammaproteobacteria bacterium]
MTRSTFARLLLATAITLQLAACDLFIDDAGRIERAQTAIADSDYRTAVIELKNVLRSSPDNLEARIMLGSVLNQTGDPAGALKELTVAREKGATADMYMIPLAQALMRQARFAEVVALNPQELFSTEKQAQLTAIAGRAELARGNSATARRLFEQALQIDAENNEALLGMARLSRERGDLEAASEMLELAMQSGTADHDSMASLGRLQFDQKKYKESEESYRAALNAATAPGLMQERMTYLQGIIEAQLALDDKPGARATARRMMQMSKDHPLALLHAARVDMLSKDYDGVMEKAQRVITMMPDFEPARLLLAGAAMAKNNYALAGTQLQAVVNNNPDNDQARKLLAQVRMSQGSPEAALEVLEPMLAHGDNDAQLLAMVGTASLREGNTERGVEYLERGVEMAADDPAILEQAAANFISAGEIDRAIEILESLPPNEEVERSDLLLILALLRKDDVEGARARTNAILESRPNDPSAHEVAGAFHLAIQEYDAARTSFEEARELAPERLAPVINLARIETLSGNPAGAEQRLKDFLKIDPGNSTVLVTLSQLAERRGDTEAGLQWLEQAREANPESAGPALLLGSYYLKNGQLKLAEERADQAVKNAPGNARAYLLQGLVLMQSNRPSEALQRFERAIEVDPNLAEAHFQYGRTQENLGAIDTAVRSYERAIELNNDLFPPRAALAGVAVRRGDYGEALEIVNGLIESYPDRAEPYTLKGEIEMQRGDLSAALTSFEKAFDISPSGQLVGRRADVRRRMGQEGALSLYEDWLNDNPDDIDTRLRLGNLHMSEQRPAQAIEQFRIAMETRPSSNTARALAVAYEAQGDLDTSEQWLGRAIELDPNALDLKIASARMDIKRGDLREAKSAVRKLRRDYPESAAVFELDGDTMTADGDHAGAAAAYERAIRLEPSSLRVMKQFNSRDRVGDAEASKLLTDWLDEHPGDTQVSMQLAQHYETKGRRDDAIVTYRRLLDRNPGDAIGWNNLAWLYLQRNRDGDIARAVTAAERAYDNRPIPAIADTYGWILLQSGEVNRATELLAEAAAGMPIAEVRYHYAVALQRSGRLDEARRELQQALDSGQDFKDRADAQRLQRELGS